MTKAYYKFVKPAEHTTVAVQQETVVVPQIDEVNVADEVAIPSSAEAMPASVETTSEPLYVDL